VVASVVGQKERNASLLHYLSCHSPDRRLCGFGGFAAGAAGIAKVLLSRFLSAQSSPSSYIADAGYNVQRTLFANHKEHPMDTIASPNNLAKQGQELADKAADRIQNGIRTAKDTGGQAADRLSDKVESARIGTRGALSQAADQADSMLSKTIEAGKQVSSTVSDVGGSVVTYTKENPVKAILISVAAGALIATFARIFNRD
jgi:hypothetical protein